MKAFAKLDGVKFFVCAAALASLAACGGGGGSDSDGNGAGTSTTVTGTAAKGAMLVGANIELTCANGAKLTAVTGGNGAYSAAGQVAYPCIGSASLGGVAYRGVLMSGAVANFTPLTDVMTEVTLAASGSGASSLSIAQFIERTRADATFAKNVAAAAASYRAAALDAIASRLLAASKLQAEIDRILAAARATPFDSTVFALGSDLDKVLDSTASTLQNPDGSVKTDVLNAAKAAGDALPLPGGAATGATGGSGN